MITLWNEDYEAGWDKGFDSGVKAAFEVVEEVLGVIPEAQTLFKDIKMRMVDELGLRDR